MSRPDRLARSERELEAARLSRGNGFTEQACGQAYYAAFYAVQEALIVHGRNAKTHSGTAQQFGRLLRDAGLPTEAGRMFSQLQKRREDTTYLFMEASEQDADETMDSARSVIAVARDLIAMDTEA